MALVASDSDEAASATATPAGSIDYGGFNPATGRPDAAPLPQAESAEGLRYDGGPEEGTSGAVMPQTAAPGVRYDGGPEEGSAGAGLGTD